MGLMKATGGFWSPYSRRGAVVNGRRDAQQDPPIPRWECEQPSHYLRQLHEAADLVIGDLVDRFVQKDSPLDQRLQQLVAAEHSNREELGRAERTHADAVERFTSTNPGVPASGAEHRVTAYWILVAFLIACELPLNATVFQVLREGQIFNYLIAFGIGLLILTAAHYAGLHLRRKPFSDKTSGTMFMVALALPLVAVLAITSLRQYYLHTRNLVDAAGEGVAYYAFLSFNLLMFAIAFYMSWFCHLDGAEELTRTRRSVERVRRELKTTVRTLRVIRAARLNLHRRYVTSARQTLDGFWQLVHVYLGENLRRRQDRKNRQNDQLLTEAAREALLIRVPRALMSEYFDYRDPMSLDVRSIGSTPHDAAARESNPAPFSVAATPSSEEHT